MKALKAFIQLMEKMKLKIIRCFKQLKIFYIIKRIK